MDNSQKKKQSPKKTTNAKGKNAKNEIDDKIKELIKTTPIPSLISICAKCNATSDNTKLYHASCNYNHNYCFNCIFQSFFANISDALNNSNNKNQIIIQCPLCCNTTLCGNIIIPSKEFNSNLKELFNKLPTNYTKLLPVCAHHNNKFTKYCDDCNCYICDFCANSEHKKHSFKSIKEKEEDIKEIIKKIPYKINNYDTKAKEINEKNEKNYNDIYTKTVNEIDKLIHVLNELKKIFINQMKINLTYYETYTDIINTSYSNYYTQVKNTKTPFADYGIPYLTFLSEVNEELKTFKLNINPSVFQEVEASRKKLEKLISNSKISSTVSLSVTCDKVHEYKCTKTIKEHTNYINYMYINKEANKLYTCSDDKLIKVYDIANDYKAQTLKGHTETINLLLPLTANKFASASEDKLIKIWEAKSTEYKCTSTLKGHTAGVTHLLSVNNEDGTPSMKLISASNDNTIRIWEPKGDYKHSMEIKAHNDKITSLVYINSKEQVISSSVDNTIKVFDLKLNNKMIFTLKEHSNIINQLYLINDSSLLSCSNDCYIIAYNTEEEYKPISKIKAHSMAVTKLKPITSEIFASLSKDKTIKLWDSSNEYKCLCMINVHKWEIHDIVFCYDTKILYSASQDKTIKATKILNWSEYNVDKSKELLWKCTSTLKSHERDVTIVDLVDNDTVISTGNDFMIKLWKEF